MTTKKCLSVAGKSTARKTSTLSSLLAEGQKTGRIDASKIEASMMKSVPDSSEFSLFLDLTKTLGIEIKEKTEMPITASSMRALNLYFRDVGRYPLLSAAQEKTLSRKARRGDSGARELMIASNLRLVVSMARRFMGRGLDLDDLIEEGNLGLITAVERYDPEKGFRFTTYAAWWIRLGIAKGLAEQSKTLKIPLHVMRTLHRYLEKERCLALELGRFPSNDEVCQAAGFGPRRSRSVSELMRGIKSLDEEAVGEAGRALSLLERTPASPTLEEVLQRQMESKNLEDLMGKLSEREKLVLRIRYGFMDGTPRSLNRTGMFLGVSRERVRQIEQRALRRLREWVEEEEQRGQKDINAVGSESWQEDRKATANG